MTGCVVCDHLVEVQAGFLASFQWKLANDVAIQEAFAEEGGFCPHHTWQLSSFSSTLGLAKGYRRLLEKQAARLIQAARVERTGFPEAFLDGERSCRVCALLEQEERNYLQEMAERRRESEIREARPYLQQGICLLHGKRLLEQTASPLARAGILVAMSESLCQTVSRMNAYISKRTALRRDLLTDEERNAIRQALVQVAGARNLGRTG